MATVLVFDLAGAGVRLLHPESNVAPRNMASAATTLRIRLDFTICSYTARLAAVNARKQVIHFTFATKQCTWNSRIRGCPRSLASVRDGLRCLEHGWRRFRTRGRAA